MWNILFLISSMSYSMTIFRKPNYKNLENRFIIMKERCPECGSERIERSENDFICRECGFVLEDEIKFSGQREIL